MLELFRLEAESQAEILSAGVLAIEEQRQSAETIESLMRAAHSLKGAARIVGLDAAVQVAHALEDVFIAAGDKKINVQPAHADILLSGIDFLSSIAASENGNDATWLDQARRCVQNLQGLLSSPNQHVTEFIPEAAGPPSSKGTNAEGPTVPENAEKTPPSPIVTQTTDRPKPQHASPEDITETKSSSTPEIETTALPPVDASTQQTIQVQHDSAKTHVNPTDSTKDEEDRVIRVSAGSLTRLVGLAGESLVEARQLRPFADSLLALRESQTDLCDQITACEGEIRRANLPPSQTALLESLRQRSAQGLDKLTKLIEAFEGFARRNEDLSERLHREVIFSRMRPLADGIHGFPRLVRDVSRQLNKQVRLVTKGEQTGVDRDILDKLEAPLSHLVRNALDHGMELPDDRVRNGKSASGTITIDAGHRAGSLTISITDDGRGINTESLKTKIISL